MGKFEAISDFYKWQKGKIISEAEIDVSRPRVFIFYGVLSTTEHEAKTALRATRKFFEDMNVKGYDFYSCHYTRKIMMGLLKYTRATTEAEKEEVMAEFGEAAVPIFDEILWPLIQIDGKRISKQTAGENLRKVVFRGHCMGSLLITKLGNELCKRMREIGYSDEEIEEITFNVRAIFSSSIVLPHDIEANFDIYSYINLGDNELFRYAGEEWRGHLLYMTGVKTRPTEPIYSQLQANNIKFVILSSLFDDKTLAELNERRGKLEEIGDKEGVKKLDKVLLGHAWSLLTDPYEDFDGVINAYDTFRGLVSKALKK